MLANTYKFCWAFRAFCYKLFFGSFGFPSYLGRPVFLTGVRRIYIGKKFRAFPGLRIEVLKSGALTIGDDVAFAQNIHITCGGRIVIGTGVCVAANVCITDIVHQYGDPQVNVLKQKDLCFPTEVGENSFVGFGAVLDAGTKLGKGCIVAANSYVKGEFPDYSVIAGSPAKLVKVYYPADKWVGDSAETR